MKKNVGLLNYLLLMTSIWLSIESKTHSIPCYPTDPEGTNPTNLCPVFPPYGVRDDSFIGGHAENGFYGRPISPREPGTPIINKPAKGSFWTNINADNGRTTIQQSNGATWNFP
jgi:hypothetical protein